MFREFSKKDPEGLIEVTNDVGSKIPTFKKSIRNASIDVPPYEVLSFKIGIKR